MVYTVCKKEQRKNRKRGQSENMKYEHITEGRFIDRPNRLFVTCGDQWTGGNGSCKEYRQVQRASDSGGTGLSGKEQQSGEKDSL